MSKHTPGPWHTGDAPYETGKIFAEPDRTELRMMIAECRGWGHLTGKGALGLPADQAATIQDANARLIAAAPELLAACTPDTGTDRLSSLAYILDRYDALEDRTGVKATKADKEARGRAQALLTDLRAAITKAMGGTP